MQTWEESKSIPMAAVTPLLQPQAGGGAEAEATATGLNPSSTYIFRLFLTPAGGAEGEEAGAGGEVGPGVETAFDTEVVSCAPKQNCCCVVS
ncbi:unnamed protein product [Discosporangium mesarthrocarpum]